MTLEQINARAEELMREERWEAAVDLIGGIQVESRSPQLNWNCGWALFQLGRLKDAAQALRRSILQSPSSAVGHWALGEVLAEGGELALAERHLLAALSIRDGATPRLSLAVVYMRQDRFEEAERVHLDGLELKPASRERLEAYADFLDDTGREAEASAARARAANMPTKPKRKRPNDTDD